MFGFIGDALGFLDKVPLVGDIVGGLFGQKGQKDANAANLELAKMQMDFNRAEAEKSRTFSAAEAAKQRDWSYGAFQDAQKFTERMSSTAYQRAVGDLVKAGLNPMLAYSQGGAPSPQSSAPSGAAATSSAASAGSAGRQENKAAAALAGASAVAHLRNIDADSALKEATAQRELASAGELEQRKTNLVEEVPRIRKQIALIEEQVHETRSKTHLNQAQQLLTEVDRMLRNGQIDLVDAQKAMTEIETRLKKLQEPEAKAFAKKFQGEYGSTVSPYAREIIDILRTLIYSRRGISN